jgi:Na+/H+-dicarboxylate symporter
MNPPWRWPLHARILLGLLLGGALGWGLGALAVARIPEGLEPTVRGAAGRELVVAMWPWLVLDLVGDVFLQGLKLVIVPLVTSSIALAIAGFGSGGGLGRLGLRTVAFYALTSMAAVLTGLVLVDLVRPGVVDGAGILVGRDLSAFAAEQADVSGRVGGRGPAAFLDVFRAMVPDNGIAAAADNSRLLGLVVVSLLVGALIGRLPDREGEVVRAFTSGVYRVSIGLTEWVLELAPIGIGGLVAATVAEQWARLSPDGRFAGLAGAVASFAAVALVGLLLHLLVTLPLILRLVARVRPTRHFRAMAPALLTAFSTASSSATLPVTLECVVERAGVSNRTASFVLPLGATVNMDGTALYEVVAAVFVCQAFGVHLDPAQQFMVAVVALLTSVGVAGVPSASLVAIAVILEAVQAQLPPGALPEGASLAAGMALLMVFDRPLDMLRTAVNVFGDSVGAVVVARLQGEEGVLER